MSKKVNLTLAGGDAIVNKLPGKLESNVVSLRHTNRAPCP